MDDFSRRPDRRVVQGSIALAKLDPAQAPYLWQRGIALYYAGRFADCRDAVRVAPHGQSGRCGECGVALSMCGAGRVAAGGPRGDAAGRSRCARPDAGDLSDVSRHADRRAGDRRRRHAIRRAVLRATSTSASISRRAAIAPRRASGSPSRPSRASPSRRLHARCRASASQLIGSMIVGWRRDDVPFLQHVPVRRQALLRE